MRAIVEEAWAWHTYVLAHAYSPEAIRRSIDFGVRSSGIAFFLNGWRSGKTLRLFYLTI